MTQQITIAGVQMSREAAEVLEACWADPAEAVRADLAALRSGERTEESLLEHCLSGADEDCEQGWHEYVDALVATVGK